jgi:hypothetical protein
MTSVIIAGPRDYEDYEVLCEAIKRAQEKGLVITEVISGTARGVDRMGERWADDNDIPIQPFKPDWNKYNGRPGKNPAGIIRNKEMADYAKENDGALLALWDGKSEGTKNMIKTAKEMGIPIYPYLVKKK